METYLLMSEPWLLEHKAFPLSLQVINASSGHKLKNFTDQHQDIINQDILLLPPQFDPIAAIPPHELVNSDVAFV